MAKKKSNVKTAVALKYDPLKDGAPKISAKGAGELAKRIIQTAIENGVPVKEDPDLVEVLAGLDLEAEVPPEVFVAVAELLAFVYSMNKKKVLPPKPGQS